MTPVGLFKGCVPAIAGTEWKERGKVVIFNELPESNLTCRSPRSYKYMVGFPRSSRMSL